MSMIEVERKRYLADAVGLQDRLAAAGYLAAGTSIEADTYYSRPDIDFMATVECLRVRQRDGFAEVTYKPASTTATHLTTDVIAKPETNVALAGPEQAAAAAALLDALGMARLCRVEKIRRTFRHPDRDGVSVVIDTIAGLGTFAETEVMADDSTAAAALLEQVEHQLGLAGCPVVALPYRDLVMQMNAGTRPF